MKSNKKFLDYFLLPKDYYAKLTDKSFWLYIGIAAVGIRDVLLAILGLLSSNEQFNDTFAFSLRSIGILLLSIIVIGFIDVLCFSYPAFDIIKLFKRRGEKNDSMTSEFTHSNILTKVMKSYIIINVIITPIDLIIYYVSSNVTPSYLAYFAISALAIMSYLWFNCAITRALGVFFKIKSEAKLLVFLLVVLWNELLGTVLGFLINKVMLFL